MAAVAEVGEQLLVRWFCSGSHQEEVFETKVLDVRKSRRDGKYSYTISFPDGEIRKTKKLEEKVSQKRKRSHPVISRPLPCQRFSLPPHRFILAPMVVGGSELAFRMLCRNYGIDIAYTPMMNSERFAVDSTYRESEFQSSQMDRPLVAHFSGNNPDILLAAARHIESRCDAIDLNLGCPQRIAHSGHFGSYLLGNEDRELVLNIVTKLSQNLSIPIFVKIRLLDTIDDTLQLCTQLRDAGAALIAIHARYRVNLVGRTGPGARDGPAHLDQVKYIKERLGSTIPIIANGNIITRDDALNNLQYTGADGVMSAEGILDNPALFADDKLLEQKGNPSSLELALQYLNCVSIYGPVKMKSVIFHVRRICKKEFEKYSLLEDCISAVDADQVTAVVQEALDYETGHKSFVPNLLRQRRAKEALARRKLEESKRKQFEARMIRKAKREGLTDLMFYLNQGATNPTTEDLTHLKSLTQEEAFEIWKTKFSQHCFSFHFDSRGCIRDRKCAFLHADPKISEGEAFG